MAVSAVIHTSSRVIRYITSDVPVLRADESAVVVPLRFDIDGGPWKLDVDNVTKRIPSSAELDAAFTPAATAKAQAVLDALTTLAADGTASANLRAFATAFKTMLTPVRRLP